MSQAQARTPAQVAPKKEKCKACGIDPEFVSEGMHACSKCGRNSYCSKECMDWDWDSGGHKRVCTAISQAERDGSTRATLPVPLRNASDSDGSIEAFDTSSGPRDESPQSGLGIMAAVNKAKAESSSNTKRRITETQPPVPQDKCKACGISSEFVPEGMKKCSRCFYVPYCCTDCMEWDWDGGGHKNSCLGVSEADRRASAGSRPAEVDSPSGSVEGSIEAFAPEELGSAFKALFSKNFLLENAKNNAQDEQQ